MSDPTNPQITRLLDLIKDELAGIARQIYVASLDGKIDWWEALPIATAGTVAAGNIVAAFRALDNASVKELLDALADSDLVLR